MRIAVLCDAFPVLSETFVLNEVRALRRAGHEVTVLAAVRGDGAAPDERPFVLADVPRARRAADAAVLALRRPRACAADLVDRRRFRAGEAPRPLRWLAPAARCLRAARAQHVHVHFAGAAALDGLRLGRLLGVPVSITAHAYDVFAAPRNLAEKLRRAAFVTTGCRYNVRHLRSLVEPEHHGKIHEIVMGVEPARFRRRTPHPERGHVVAVGRLVEKKGFADLVAATAMLRDRGTPPGRVTIAGDGPLAGELREQVSRLGLDGLVRLPGALCADEVRDLLEEATVLAVPSVVAADGDRDSMPVAAKEAMAMEVPVIATNEVGLPELVDAACGRLVPPRDPGALADAVRELLELPVTARAELGRAGRARVLERCDVDRETARLAELMRR